MKPIPSPDVAGHKACILIVDDESHNRDLLDVMLRPEGYLLLTAASGEEALATIAKEPPDLVLLDVLMPGMDGYEVATILKGDSGTKDIPIIVISALGDRNAIMLGLNAGAEDFLTKPVDRAELAVRVRNLLRLKAAIGEARALRALADHANSAKTQFLQTMSHELRTPLTSITGYAELLELGVRGVVNPAQAKDLGRIREAAAYLLRLLKDVLTVASDEGGRPLELITIAVNPVLAEVDGLCTNMASAKGITLTIALPGNEVFVFGDPERFQQILLNLITNAVKFTHMGGSITVTCDCDETMARFQVHDTGVGIGAADVERVFEPFVQLDRQLTTAAQRGVGLGLSISRGLARAMHGDLTLQSLEGVGSTFTLTLPIALEPSVTDSTSYPLDHRKLEVSHPGDRHDEHGSAARTGHVAGIG
jgi:two-component system sensor histidine kinase/response regulator